MKLFFLLIPAVVLAAEPDSIALARSAAPEAFADVVLRSIGKVPRAQQLDLLEEAFAAAGKAKEPIRLIAMPGTPPDTRELYRSKAADAGLDVLSLQSRIVQATVQIDAVKGRELFERIPRPKLDVRPCVDPLIADASAYYDAAAVIAQFAYKPGEKESELHIEFLNGLLASAQSPNEIASFARSLQTMALTKDQSLYLLRSIGVKLELAAPDYRPFATSLDALQAELAKLMDSHRAARDEVIRALRTYIGNQLKAPRCLPEIALGLDEITWLKPPIVVDDFRSTQLYEPFRAHAYFDDEESKRIGESLRAKPSDIAAFMRQFDAWKPAGTEIDVFHQRATVLRALLQTIPRGDGRTQVIAAAASLLNGGIERAYPAEWKWEATAMLESAGSERGALIDGLKASVTAQIYFTASSGTSK